MATHLHALPHDSAAIKQNNGHRCGSADVITATGGRPIQGRRPLFFPLPAPLKEKAMANGSVQGRQFRANHGRKGKSAEKQHQQAYLYIFVFLLLLTSKFWL